MLFDPKKYQPVKIDLDSVKVYAEKHGSERTQGYLDALNDIANNLEGICYEYDMGKYSSDQSHYATGKKLRKYRVQMNEMFKSINRSKPLQKMLHMQKSNDQGPKPVD